MNGRHHSAVEQIAGLMNAGRIDENDLAFRQRDNALYLMPRGLRFVRDGGDLFADQPIQKGRFAGIRPADKRDVTAVIIGF